MRLLFILSVICFSCQKDPDFYVCPDEAKVYLETFKSEGKKRGINIKWKGLKVVFTNYPVCNGNAGCYSHENHTISIDTSSNNWDGEYHREILIFHELGHGILKRPHRNDTYSNDTELASIMHCCSVVDYDGIYLYKRKYYIDELFNQNTSKPSWAF